ncbi:Crp/Fnr family transcriptional regulator [Gorillibacterium massiliense]|uniref:Crp/Fnr family transcriptional regulator n=1 Tax=Gorillibacterium massiliense TaxID=1280390 RepID=UPI0004B6E011|nr:Crp/Fnr family transcriptional regulator [Gorillibacterium massiliense]
MAIDACCHSCAHEKDSPCLSKVPLFSKLSSSELADLQPLVRTRVYSKGEFIFQEGEGSDSLFIVNSGTVKISKLSGEGKEKIIRFLFTGDFFGQFALLQEKMHDSHAIVLDDAMVCSIRRQDFLPIMEANAKMAHAFLLAMSERLHETEEWMGTVTLLEAEQRLAKLLLLFFGKNGHNMTFELPVPKKELAALIATTPETFSRKLASLEEQGIIAVSSKSITIRDLESLQMLAG